jgi:riboflavin transporter FmnP
VTAQPDERAHKTHWQARQLATMALFIALGAILSFIEFPLIPGVPFLKYDASTVAAMVAGLTYGAGSGCLVGVLIAAIHGLFSGNLWGALMNAVVVIAFVLPTALGYRHNKSVPFTIIMMLVSSVAMLVAAVVMNLLVTPIYMGVPFSSVVEMIVPILVPFNIIKAVINCVISFILLKTLGNYIK